MPIEKGRNYVRFLFDDIVEGVLLAMREELPEFTETDNHEPLVQFARQVGFVGHRDASMIDLNAGELSWPTLQRRRSAVALATLVGQSLLPASPASVDVLLDLTGDPGPADIVLGDLALMRSPGDADSASAVYESQAGDVAVGNLEYTTIAEDASTFSAPAVQTQATPWATPSVNDAIYYGHAVLTFSGIKLTGAGSPTQYSTGLEYYDGRYRAKAPDSGSVVVGASGITADADAFLGTTNGYEGLTVRVTCIATDAYEDVLLGPTNSFTTTSFLGQASPSTNAADYRLTAEWLPLTDVAQFTPSATTYERELTWRNPTDLQADGAAAERKWQKATVNGVEAYWIRERIYSAGGAPVGPTQVDAEVLTNQTWALQVTALQGETVTDTLGRTTGIAFEEMDLVSTPHIGGSISEMSVAGDVEWLQVDGLLAEDEDSKVFQLLERPDGTRYVSWGDGTNGRIPPSGSLVTLTHRVNADDNGNVGAGAVTNAETGANFLTNIRNPREAYGWKGKEGDTVASLARVKRLIPAGVRTARSVAVTPEDVAWLATQTFRTTDSRSPFARVAAVEQGAGFKTTLAVCVGAGGQVPTQADIDELQSYFNGTTSGFQRFDGVALANQQVIAVPYVPLDVTVQATLYVATRYAPAAAAKADAAIRDAINPLSATEDGVYRHVPGGQTTEAFFLSLLGLAQIYGLVDVTLVVTPSLPITYTSTQLPRLSGDPQITIVEV